MGGTEVTMGAGCSADWPGGYTSARELFFAAREASREAGRIRRRSDAMRVAESVRAQGYEPGVSHTRADVNGTARTEARIDFEAASERRLAEDDELVAVATSLLYGPKGAGGGVEALMGGCVADAMYFRFCAAQPWDVVAAACSFSVSQVRRLVRQGLDMCEALGWEALRAGRGCAED